MGLVCALAVSASVVRAQSALPSGWASRDVGSTGILGGAAVSSGTWMVAGSGTNIWGTSDEFRFAYRQITGDVDIRVRLASFEDVNWYSKAGVMIRETLNANSRNAYLMLMPDSGRVHAVATEPRRGNVAADWPRWRRSCLVASGSTGQPVHQLLFRERDVLDVGRYDDNQHDRRSLCRPGGDGRLRRADLDSDIHQSSGQRRIRIGHHHASRAMGQPRPRQPQRLPVRRRHPGAPLP